jgi:hypothetical protein
LRITTLPQLLPFLPGLNSSPGFLYYTVKLLLATVWNFSNISSAVSVKTGFYVDKISTN